MKVRGMDFVAYDVSDLQRAVAFYRDTLGLKKSLNHEKWGWVEFRVPPLTLALCGPKSKSWGAPYAGGGQSAPGSKGEGSVALAVEDVKTAVAELKGKGVTFLVEIGETRFCYFAVLLDPDGNRVWLHQRKDGTWG
ncbi:VOC family protein [Candidatus Poribacteria bacterium]|nr:VOC family protein [Candidatus Poribacteria bacterium]